MSRRLRTLVALGTLFAVVSLSAVGLARRQEPAKGKKTAALELDDPLKGEETKPLHFPPAVDDADPPFDPKAVEAIRPIPHPLPDEPPHEGAMIKIPYVIEPPDTLLVVVSTGDAALSLDASVERLVTPDGMVELDGYGRLYIAGLTLDQAKEKLISYFANI